MCEFNLNAPDGGNKSNVENFYFPTCNFTRDEMRNCKTKKIFIRDCETRSRLTFSRLPLSLARLQKRSRRRAKRERRVADVFRDFSKRGKISISLTIATTNHVYTSRTLALDRRSTLAHSLSLSFSRTVSLVPESWPGNTAAPETKAIPAGERRAASYYMISGANDLNNFRAAAPVAEFCKTDLQLSRGNRVENFASYKRNRDRKSPCFISDLHRAN